MLELDLLLLPFVESAYPSLAEKEKVLFEQLLAHHDQQLYDWLVKWHPVNDPALRVLVEQIRYQTMVEEGT